MSQLTVDVNLCQKDGACAAVCPTWALALDEDGYPTRFAGEKCILCGHCMAVCSTGALAHEGMAPASFEPLPGPLPTPELMDSLLKSRRSIRVFRAQPVKRETVLTLLDIARRAPTAKNSQKLQWIVVYGADKVRALARETINGYLPADRRPELMDALEKGRDQMLRGAPLLVVACAPTEYGWGTADAAIALSYFEMAAKARGIGVCWAGYLMNIAAAHPPLRHMLNVPDGYSVRGAMMAGEGKFTYRRVPPRKELNVHWC